MLGNMDPKKLLQARAYIENLKNDKLAFRAERYYGEPHKKDFTLLSLRKHLLSEIVEFEAGYNHQNSKEMIEELADISSMCDVIAMKLLEHCVPYCKPEDLKREMVDGKLLHGFLKCRKCGMVVHT
jgi:NTP pyrophosphatase (non-canonical NTP hydrolase)